MPKMKTKKSAAKRMSLTARGKVKYKKMNLRHILTKRSPKRKRQLRAAGILDEDSSKKVRKQLLPYASVAQKKRNAKRYIEKKLREE